MNLKGSKKIVEIGYSEVVKDFSGMRKERVALSKDSKTKYLALYINDVPVGVVGWMELNAKSVRFKTDYVRPRFRGMGFYSLLWIEREKRCLNYMSRSAYCTTHSWAKYKKSGFVQVSKNRGIVYCKYEMV